LLFFLSKHSNSVRKQIAYLDIYIKNEKNIERNLIIEKLKSEIRLLNSAITSIETAMDLVNNENVRTENIKGVYNSLPGNTEVLSFSIDKDSLNMQCISDSMDEVLCLLRNLEGLYFVESVYIPAIQSMKDMKYSYTIICNFKVNYEG
jgi:Tfp pilus assembly protein PilN